MQRTLEWGQCSVRIQEAKMPVFPRGKMPVWLIFPPLQPPQEQAGDTWCIGPTLLPLLLGGGP